MNAVLNYTEVISYWERCGYHNDQKIRLIWVIKTRPLMGSTEKIVGNYELPSVLEGYCFASAALECKYGKDQYQNQST